MKSVHGFLIAGILSATLCVGCREAAPDKPGHQGPQGSSSKVDERIKASFAKLGEEDRKLAEAQKFCAVEEESRLGSMGAPIKVLLNDEPVFLCCKSCQKKALAEPDKTLAKAKELKAKAGGS